MTKAMQTLWNKNNFQKFLLAGFIMFFIIFGANLKNNFLGNIFTAEIKESIFQNVSGEFENIIDKKVEKVGENLYKITFIANKKGKSSLHFFKYLLELENDKIKKIIEL